MSTCGGALTMVSTTYMARETERRTPDSGGALERVGGGWLVRHSSRPPGEVVEAVFGAQSCHCVTLADGGRLALRGGGLCFIGKTVDAHGVTRENGVFYTRIEIRSEIRQHFLGSAEQRDLVRIIDREHRRARNELRSESRLSKTFDVVQSGDKHIPTDVLTRFALHRPLRPVAMLAHQLVHD